MNTLTQSPTPVQDFDGVDQACDGTGCHDETRWPYPHTHCSGCDGKIEYEGEFGYELPAGAHVCSCGRAIHDGCECHNEKPPSLDRLLKTRDAASFLGLAVVEKPVPLASSMTQIRDEFSEINAKIAKIEGSESPDAAELAALEAQAVLLVNQAFGLKVAIVAAIDRVHGVPLPLGDVA